MSQVCGKYLFYSSSSKNNTFFVIIEMYFGLFFHAVEQFDICNSSNKLMSLHHWKSDCIDLPQSYTYLKTTLTIDTL